MLLPARAPRRHLDGSATAALKALPRAELKRRRLAVRADLARLKEADDADALAAGHGIVGQLELIPRDLQDLPLHKHPTADRLPPPESLYYSAAREP